ncbi:hypothetical protein [uncultured Microbulbifer sp.]|uniref:hypothetical protein n=1 Tax=uncultured Microbulbifer sp. TaxID=348147 RepID=UPI0026335699|nr:hypothetical protein [uncultured Microbulbifer sp.]
MGLDWNPANKAKPGHEEEFRKITKMLLGRVWWGRKKLEQRFSEISIPALETLKVPQVGIDKAATEWAKEKYRESAQEITEDEFVSQLIGYYVLELSPPSDGIPDYSNSAFGYVDAYSFRAQFLKECEDIIGKDLLNKAFEYQQPAALVNYGDQLIESANKYSATHRLQIPEQAPDEIDTPTFYLHIVVSAGRWCKFWGSRGHMLEPYF